MTQAILIVDDNALNLKLVKLLLVAAGFEVLSATGAEQAMQILEGQTPCLILMDIQMPGVDGLELTRILKADSRKSACTVVALTAYAMKGDRARILAAGCDGYISKPIDADSFVDTVTRYLPAA